MIRIETMSDDIGHFILNVREYTGKSPAQIRCQVSPRTDITSNSLGEYYKDLISVIAEEIGKEGVDDGLS